MAYFSGDTNLQSMLDGELAGGHKVHAITAGMLYDIDPGDAKTHKIVLQGNEVVAYVGGKRLRHAWSYGLKAKEMAKQFWISESKAQAFNDILCDAHPDVVTWWKELGDEVFGVHRFVCPRCDGHQTTGGDCGHCRGRTGRYFPQVKWDGWEREATRILYTPFGRRRIYLGRRQQSMNAVIAQKPQSCGASMWYRTLGKLHQPGGSPGYNALNLVFTGSYEELTGQYLGATMVVTGTYDSFLVQCPSHRQDDVLQWLTYTMELPWSQLGGLRIPVDVKAGYNWRETDGNESSSKSYGLTSVGYKPFSSTGIAG